MHLQRSSETSKEESQECYDGEHQACRETCSCWCHGSHSEAGHQGGNEASGFCKTCPDHEACATGYPFYTCCSPLA